MIFPVDIPQKFIDASDGASMPLSMRLWIRDKYPIKVLHDIDNCGIYHDYLAEAYPHRHAVNEAKFVLFMNESGIPHELIKMISLGLSAYDVLPTVVQKRVQLVSVVYQKPPMLQPIYNLAYSLCAWYFKINT